MDDVTFEAPGAGQWALDRSHFPGGATPLAQWLMEEGMEAGMRRVMAEIGTPADSLRARFVHGFMYTRLIPLIGADKPATRLPPTPILKAVAHLHPQFRRRAKAAAATMRDRPSLAVAEQWERETKPRLAARNREFAAVDMAALDDGALARHVRQLLDDLRANAELHFWLHGHDLGPLASYLHRCLGWGIPAVEAVAALAGASPATSAPLLRLVELRRLLDAAGVKPRTLGDVRAASPDAAAMLDEHLIEFGDRIVTGYDLDGLTLRELPGSLLASIVEAREPATVDHTAIAAALRLRVPAADRSSFDDELRVARAVMNMRDDNGPMTFEWPAGLLRRAMLEAGRRLAAARRLVDPEHVFELRHDEVVALVDSGSTPTAQEIATRAARRAHLATLTPPDTLGPPEPQPSPDVLPKPLPLMVAMVQTALAQLDMGADPKTDRMVGAGIGTTPYRGRVRRAASAEEAIDSLEPGDVLVVRATSPAFNVILPIAGAIVTANGGPLSHAAVLARELGIPAVVGMPGAMELIDGSDVEVDPRSGRVTVVG